MIDNSGIIKDEYCPKCKALLLLKVSEAESIIKIYAGGIYMCCKDCYYTKKPMFRYPYEDINTNAINLFKLLWCHWTKQKYVDVHRLVQCNNQAFTKVVHATRKRCIELLSDIVIGGDGAVVEIDETAINKRKYNVG